MSRIACAFWSTFIKSSHRGTYNQECPSTKRTLTMAQSILWTLCDLGYIRETINWSPLNRDYISPRFNFEPLEIHIYTNHLYALQLCILMILWWNVGQVLGSCRISLIHVSPKNLATIVWYSRHKSLRSKNP